MKRTTRRRQWALSLAATAAVTGCGLTDNIQPSLEFQLPSLLVLGDLLLTGGANTEELLALEGIGPNSFPNSNVNDDDEE